MALFTRRDALAVGAGALAGTTVLGRGGLRAEVAVKDVQPPQFAVEEGASLRVLRPSKFVQGDETVFLENSKKFSDQHGVPVTVTSESWEDLRPKTATAAAIGSGPDIVLAWSDDPHKFASQCLDLTDLATYLGEKYGGWYPLAERYGKGPDGNWIAMPIGASAGRVVYRKSWVNEAGFDTVPTDLDGFLNLCRKLKEQNHPAGLALGNAVGDANAWCNWVVWTHGGAMVDEENQVTINSPETIEALKYAKALYETFIPGTESWLDPSNNKAFLAGQIGLTQNGISVYYAAKNSEDPAIKAMAEDIFHARMPVGPVGRPTERCLLVNPMVFGHTEYPNAAKEYLRFMMEKEQYEPWLTASIGYWGHPLAAYEGAAIWTADPKHEVYKTVVKDSIWDGYEGSLGEASAAVLADFVMVQMVASAATGQATPEEAAQEAERRAKRYYRS
ncbi:MAG TPA: extracellular solute-binding protein [Geminicoccaceae bacterium]|jgi:multiple sugar transport system substrate-binding protein|nr:extracellular solute-binding protein [Geminicoccaceae bacterium]